MLPLCLVQKCKDYPAPPKLTRSHIHGTPFSLWVTHARAQSVVPVGAEDPRQGTFSQLNPIHLITLFLHPKQKGLCTSSPSNDAWEGKWSPLERLHKSFKLGEVGEQQMQLGWDSRTAGMNQDCLRKTGTVLGTVITLVPCHTGKGPYYLSHTFCGLNAFLVLHLHFLDKRCQIKPWLNVNYLPRSIRTSTQGFEWRSCYRGWNFHQIDTTTMKTETPV